jgi:hypothetical protein
MTKIASTEEWSEAIQKHIKKLGYKEPPVMLQVAFIQEQRQLMGVTDKTWGP